MSAEELSKSDIMRCLLENYRLFEVYYRDHGVEEVLYRGVTYNFLDILKGAECLTPDEWFAIRWVYIDQKPTTKKYLKEMGYGDLDMVGLANSGVERLAQKQEELFSGQENV